MKVMRFNLPHNTRRILNHSITPLKSLCLSGLFFITSTANADDYIIPDVPKIDAKAYILIDAASGQILAENNAHERRDPASLTKMMTTYVLNETIDSGKIKPQDTVIISKNSWAEGNPILKGSSLMFLKPGDKVSVEDLNKGIIIQSGNDACIAIAEYVAGSEDAFVSLMNSYAKRLNLSDTQFQTVHGLDAPEQYTTASDMAQLAKATIINHPTAYKIYSEKEFTFNNIKQQNRNGLLWDTTLHVDGLKTGHTNLAGYNLVASAIDGNTRLISVVLGGTTFKGREIETKKLLTWGFRFFETYNALAKEQTITSLRIWYGKENKVKLGSDREIKITIPRGQANNLKTTYQINSKELHAPLKKGQHVGVIRFTLDNKVVAETPLVSLDDIDKTGFFGTAFQFIKHTFFKLF